MSCEDAEPPPPARWSYVSGDEREREARIGDFQQIVASCTLTPGRINTADRTNTVALGGGRRWWARFFGQFAAYSACLSVIGRFAGPRWRSPAGRVLLLARAARAARPHRHPLLLRPRTAVAPSADALTARWFARRQHGRTRELASEAHRPPRLGALGHGDEPNAFSRYVAHSARRTTCATPPEMSVPGR